MQRTNRSGRGVDFIGVGMIKSGSSWLGEILAEHPSILFSRQTSSKEIKFFNKPFNLAKGVDWYLKQFPPQALQKIRGEFTPGYMMDRGSARRIAEHFPDVKIIVALRNPIDMLYSYHRDKLASPWYLDVPDFESSVLKGKFDDIECHLGDYSLGLAPFYEYFPREQIFVTLMDDISSDPLRVSRQLFSFLGVEESFHASRLFSKINGNVEVRSAFIHKLLQHFVRVTKNTATIRSIQHSPRWNEILYHGYRRVNCCTTASKPLQPITRSLLSEYYSESNDRLGDLIRRDLSAWNAI